MKKMKYVLSLKAVAFWREIKSHALLQYWRNLSCILPQADIKDRVTRGKNVKETNQNKKTKKKNLYIYIKL